MVFRAANLGVASRLRSLGALWLLLSCRCQRARWGGIPLVDLPPQERSGPALSTQAQSEVGAKLQRIFAKYGDRLSDDQKKLMRRTVENHVRMLEVIRPIPVTNGDPPATVLKLVTDKSSVHSRASALSGMARKPRKVARSVKKEK